MNRSLTRNGKLSEEQRSKAIKLLTETDIAIKYIAERIGATDKAVSDLNKQEKIRLNPKKRADDHYHYY